MIQAFVEMPAHFPQAIEARDAVGRPYQGRWLTDQSTGTPQTAASAWDQNPHVASGIAATRRV